MKIGLIDVDGHNFPNLALMKISTWEKAQGNNVEMAQIGSYDRLYMAKVFSGTPDYNGLAFSNDIIKGGTGYDLKIKLPDEIENCDPDYSVYPSVNYSIQFFSRGCIRKCPFCVVPEKEGGIYPVRPMNLNPAGEWIEILDNSFFANPEWKSACELILKWQKPVNLHGVDLRILEEDHAVYLN